MRQTAAAAKAAEHVRSIERWGERGGGEEIGRAREREREREKKKLTWPCRAKKKDLGGGKEEEEEKQNGN